MNFFKLNGMKYFNHKLIALAMAGCTCWSCTDEYDCTLLVEKPEDVANSEYLATFDMLKSYIDRGESPFQLSATLSASEFAEKKIAYSTALSNFDAVDVNGSYTPLNSLNENNVYTFGGMQLAANTAADAGLTLYGGVLCSNQGQRTAYYNQLIAPVDVPAEVQKGKTHLFDFENDELGKSYPMTNGSTAFVDEDPEGKTGHVLHVGTDEDKAANSFPILHVVLPEGRKLGDYVRLIVDMRVVKDHGIYGQGIFVLINGTEYNLGINANGFIGGGDKWIRGGIISLKDASAKPGCALPESLANLTEFDLGFGTKSGGAQYYLDQIVMEYESGAGATKIDFESDELGTSYPMTNDGTCAVVAQDPDGRSGKVLHIEKSNHQLPKFKVKLAEGKTLADYTGMSMDMRIVKGMYGWGMRLHINGKEFNPGKNAAEYGIAENAGWVRGGFYVTFVKEGTYTALGKEVPKTVIEIPNSLKDLTEFEFAVGSESGEWTGDIDNLIFTWEAKPQHIEKTPEEKKAIFTEEMEKWVGGMVYAGVNETKSVKAWNVIGNPLDDTNNSETFKWGEYLGEVDYARKAVEIARDTVKNVGVELDLFVSQTFGQYDEMDKKAEKLIALVDAWEEDDVTKINGYNIELSAIYSKSPMMQEGNVEIITKLFEKLAQTQKLIRISNLSMMVESQDGNFIAANKLSLEDREAAAAYLSFIMQEYRRLIPADKQYGISLSGLTESGSGYKLSPWTSGYNRNTMYEGVVNGLK